MDLVSGGMEKVFLFPIGKNGEGISISGNNTFGSCTLILSLEYANSSSSVQRDSKL